MTQASGCQGAIELLTRVAYLYYREAKTQNEVAREVGISRHKVQRLLQRARQEGIVEINIHALPLVPIEIEKKLKAHFPLKEAVVTAGNSDEIARRRSVARAAASYLERQTANSMVVAVGMGRNLDALAEAFAPSQPVDCTFISAMGGSPLVGESINPNDICRRLAAAAGGRAASLFAPAYVESQRVQRILLSQEAVAQTLARARQAHMALVGIGTPEDNCTLVRMGSLSLAEARRLCQSDAIGDVLGYFFDLQGREVPSDLHGRLIGLTLQDLKSIPKVMAIVSEEGKAPAILGVLRTGAVHVLVTDADNALEVLKLVGLKTA
jgi:DNA-binding transcriptional regulator LsrR (DeoR family)